MPDAIDLLRQSLTQPQGQGQSDAITSLRNSQTDVSKLPEFSEKGLPVFGSDLEMLPKIETTLKLFLSDDPERLANSLKGVEGINVGRGQNNLPFVEVGGKKYQLNREGLSQQDLANFTTQLVSQIGLGKLTRLIPGLRGMYPSELIAGGLSTGGKELATQAAAGEEINPLAAAGEGVIGTAGSLVGLLLGSAFGRLFKQGAQFLVNGSLTRTAQEALKKAGIDIGTLDQKTLNAADTILKREVGRRPTPTEMVKGVAKADTAETGIPLRQGQATGSLEDLSGEVKLEEGIRGVPAQDTMRRFAATQDEKVREAVEGTALRESPNVPPVTEAEAGGRVRSALQETASDVEEAVDKAYRAANDAAEASGIKVSSNFNLVRDRFNIRKLGLATVNEGTAPKTAAVVDFIKDQFEIANKAAREAARAQGIKDPKVLAQIYGELSPTELEGIRKAIGKGVRETKDATDQGALKALRDKFDEFLDDSVGSQDPAIVDLYKQARDIAGVEKRMLTKQGANDPGGKLIEDTINDLNVDQGVVDKVFGGGRKIDKNGQRVFERLSRTLAGKPEAIEALRQTMVRRIVFGTADKQAIGRSTPQGIADAIDQALEGTGAEFVSNTLGRETLRDLQVLRRQIGRLIRPDKLGNPPRSGFLNEAAARAIGRLGIAGAIGSGAGGAGMILGGPIAGPLIGLVAGGATKLAVDKLAARAGRKAAEKAIKQAPILGPVARLGAKARPITGPVSAVAQGLLPRIGAPTASSLFDLYGPELELE